MRILLDECVDHRLARELAGHEVSTVAGMAWRGKTNGELLRLAVTQFDVFLTTDRNLSFQQNTADLKLAVVVLNAPSNRLSDLRPLIPEVLQVLQFVRRGEVRSVG